MRRTFFAAFVAALPAQSFIMSCPDISFATSKDFQEVYEPDSDSWLLMDSLSVETDLLRSLSPSICLEIGVGSGAVLTHLATLLGPSAALYLGVDINPHATRLAQRTGKHNGVSLELVQTSLMDGLLPRLRNVVDVLLFNPPYVPTPSEELVGLGIQRSWAGGARGREILDRLLPFISEILSPKGMFYLITVDDNDPEEIISVLAEQGLEAKLVMRKKAHNEKLQVLRFCRLNIG